jgi:hypothetical protein
MKMIKKYVVVGILVLGVASSALAANALVNSNCNYDSSTGYYVSDGTVYAHGTMNNAFQCAMSGLLPKIVADRLGIFGDASTKDKAKETIKTNEDVKAKKAAVITTEEVKG